VTDGPRSAIIIVALALLRLHKTAAAVAVGLHSRVPQFEFQANAISSYYFAARRSDRSPRP